MKSLMICYESQLITLSLHALNYDLAIHFENFVLRSKPEMLFGTDLVVKSDKSRSDSLDLDRKMDGEQHYSYQFCEQK